MDNPVTRVCLLGGFSVATADGLVEERAWRLRKAKALVKLLALAPERRLHRERLADLLWPDRDAEAAANNLHQALHAARRAIGPEALRLSDGVVALEAEIDVDAFEAAAARARATGEAADYEAALDLHAGELLPEDRYESWADARRAALLELHGALCVELAELYGDDAQAVAALQRALVVDPLAEPAHRALMRLYAATGRRQQALAQYQLLRQQLDAELAAEPDPETRGLYRELLAPEPATDTRGNLPHPLTSFVGRERERGEILRLLDRVRMLTLIGPGGCGKTRLAIETLAGIEPLPDGIWFVELAGLTDGALVAQATALAVGVPIPAQRSAQEALAAHLAGRQAIIVLDNCEHVIDACARLAEDLLRAGPGVRVLATSREPLRCEGEVAWRVPSLAEASGLFVERAAADPGFARRRTRRRSTRSASAWTACRWPSSWPRRASRRCRSTRSRPACGDNLDVLAGGSRTARTRQQTLRATIEWSHDLLTGEERVLFRRLSVFADGFTLEAAEEVCAGGAIARRRIVDLLARLVDKSLVVAADRRFRLLDTIRHYAAERLDASAEQRHVAVRHLDWCLALADEHDPLSAGPRRSLRTLENEHDNLRAAPGLRAAPRSAGRPAPGHVAVALLAGPRLLRRGRPLARSDAGRRPRAHRRCASRRCWPAPGSRCAAATPSCTCVASQPPSRLPRAGRRARDGRGALPARDARAVGQQHRARRRALRRRDRLSPPARRPAAAGRRDVRVGDDVVVPLRHASRPACVLDEALGAPGGGPRRRHALLRPRDLRPVPAARRAGRRARACTSRRPSSCSIASGAPRPSATRSTTVAWTARATGDVDGGHGRAGRGARSASAPSRTARARR